MGLKISAINWTGSRIPEMDTGLYQSLIINLSLGGAYMHNSIANNRPEIIPTVSPAQNVSLQHLHRPLQMVMP